MNKEEELAHLRAPSADPKQRMIDYWGRRAERAEAQVARLAENMSLAKALAVLWAYPPVFGDLRRQRLREKAEAVVKEHAFKAWLELDDPPQRKEPTNVA